MKAKTIFCVPPEIRPFGSHPDVPKVIPKVWLLKEPLVVTAKICGPIPFCPRQAIEPKPQPVESTAPAFPANIIEAKTNEAK